jgi:hypothetical protein
MISGNGLSTVPKGALRATAGAGKKAGAVTAPLEGPGVTASS